MKTASCLVAALVLATAGTAFGAEDSSTTAAASAAPVAAAAAATAKPVQVARPLTRAEVRAQAIEARRNGTMIETEADMDVARTRNQVAR